MNLLLFDYRKFNTTQGTHRVNLKLSKLESRGQVLIETGGVETGGVEAGGLGGGSGLIVTVTDCSWPARK